MNAIRRLFRPEVGLRGSVTHLFEEFQDSLGERRQIDEPVSSERRASKNSRVSAIVAAARERGWLLPKEVGELRQIWLCLLSKDDCEEWLGYRDLLSDQKPEPRQLANWIRQWDWDKDENVEHLRLFRNAAFIELLRPGALDWQTPNIGEVEVVREIAAVFSRPSGEVDDQRDIIHTLFDPRVRLEQIVKRTRGPRLQVSYEDLYYVWETRALSHEERAREWDERTPKPFKPFGRSNVEMYSVKKLQARWRSAVNRLLAKAYEAFGPRRPKSEREPS